MWSKCVLSLSSVYICGTSSSCLPVTLVGKYLVTCDGWNMLWAGWHNSSVTLSVLSRQAEANAAFLLLNIQSWHRHSFPESASIHFPFQMDFFKSQCWQLWEVTSGHHRPQLWRDGFREKFVSYLEKNTSGLVAHSFLGSSHASFDVPLCAAVTVGKPHFL